MRDPRLLHLGDAAWTVEFGEDVDPAVHARVLGYAATLEAARAAGELDAGIEWVPSFRSLTVHFDPLAVDARRLGARLLALARQAAPVAGGGRRLRVPVCFGGEGGPDLDDVAAAAGRTPEHLVEALTSRVMRVYLIGFMPGFAYIGDLPEPLRLPRLATPRTRVPARSFAIAGRLCGVYPFASPGGWRLLGRTPVALFDAGNAAAPTLFQPGDQVRWQAVSASECATLEALPATELWRRCQVDAEATWPA